MLARFRGPPSTWHPTLFRLAVAGHRMVRRTERLFDGRAYASSRDTSPLLWGVARHESLLIRRAPTIDARLQHGKVTNLDRAIPQLDGVLVRPGETLSFWRCVGPPTRARGFVEGLELSRGAPRAGVGGGLCQLVNMIHWLALHTPLLVVERHHHSVDVFPDDGRVVPFGCGATVFFDYLDYRLANPTDTTFQLSLSRTGTHLVGELRANKPLVRTFRVIERAHRFTVDAGVSFRENEIWREIHDPATGAIVREELVYRNRARVLYERPARSPTTL